MFSYINNRVIYGLGFLGTVIAITYALYLEHWDGLEACPLCIFQRISMILLGIVLLAACLHNPKGIFERIYNALAALSAISGILVAARHIWLQHLPKDQVPACGPGLDYLMDAFPLADVFSLVLTGSGECASVDWQFLGLSLPEATAVIFSAYIIVYTFLAFYPWSKLQRKLINFQQRQ